MSERERELAAGNEVYFDRVLKCLIAIVIGVFSAGVGGLIAFSIYESQHPGKGTAIPAFPDFATSGVKLLGAVIGFVVGVIACFTFFALLGVWKSQKIAESGAGKLPDGLSKSNATVIEDGESPMNRRLKQE